MKKVLQVARREFVSTALTKGFIVGALVLPAVFALIMPVIAMLFEQAKAPADVGRVAIIDRSGMLDELLAERLTPEALVEARRGSLSEFQQNAESGGGEGEAPPDLGQVAQIADTLMGETPKFTVDILSVETDLEDAQNRLREEPENEDDRTLALVEVDPDAVVRPEGQAEFGSYSLFTRPKVDPRTTNTIERTVERAIKDVRYEMAGMDREELRRLTSIAQRDVQEVTETGTRESNQVLQFVLPGAVLVLLFMGVMTGGQYLLTTTVEEKSSRVVEVLLSAVSPMELMFGKILGQMFVGMCLLLVYTGVGIFAMLWFALADLIDWTDLIYMFIFFLIAYTIIASLMAAIGAAVNEMREAQSLMAPVMMALVFAFYLSFPAMMSPSAPWAVAMSFIPPFSPFTMLIRIASTEPPPVWQIWLSIAIGSAFAYGCVWFAAKVFRVGLLMFGKPPNFKTLIKWVRMA
jgi:ABC-type Na+ efflux pump permease subunit